MPRRTSKTPTEKFHIRALAKRSLAIINALLGRSKRIHVASQLFHSNHGCDAVLAQVESKPQKSVRRHPERSRFSGGVKDLPLDRPDALATLQHPTPSNAISKPYLDLSLGVSSP
jgi:hypothetical protein